MGWRYLNLSLVFLSLAGGSWSQSGPGQPAGGPHSSQAQPQPGGAVRRHRMGAIVGWRDWRRNDPTVFNSLWKSKTPLGNAELYIVLALLIGLVTVVIGCWLSDNCWSPEPEQLTTLA